MLTENLSEEGNSRKIDNAKGTFMAVHVDYVTKCSIGQVFAIAHHYQQEGDMMRVPDMEFIKGADAEYYPISFWQDAPLTRDDAVEWEDSEITRIDPKMQAAMVSFANTWIKNIKDQQRL